MTTDQRELARSLRDTLASLYPRVRDAQRVLADGGINEASVNLNGSANTVWYEVLRRAKGERLDALLAVALSDYPQHAALHALAAQRASLTGKPPSDRDRRLEALEESFHLAPPESDGARVATPLAGEYEEILARHRLFGGRDEELRWLDGLVGPGPGGYALVTGPAGFGKSALLAHWIRRLREAGQAVCHHFIRRPEQADEARALQNLCAQLAAFHDLRGSVPSDVATLQALHPQLLGLAPAAPGTLVVVLDGLDEAQGWTPGARMFPRRLPAGVRVVCSAREMADRDWLERLELDPARTPTRRLDALGEGEVAALLRTAGEEAAGLASDGPFVRALWERSGGDPFYVHLLVEDVLARLERGDPVTREYAETLEKGLAKYLDTWWKQDVLRGGLDDPATDLLCYLQVAKGRLSYRDLHAISREDALTFANIDGALERLARYVLGDQASGYELCHPRFQLYLQDRIPPEDLDARRRDLLDYCARFHEHHSRYALAHYAAHLEDAVEGAGAERAQRVRRLVEVVSDPVFQTDHKRYVDDLAGLQADLERALRVAAGEPDPVATVRGALALDRFRQRDLRPEGLFELARRGDAAAARRRLALFDVDSDWRRAALILVAWLARDRGADAADAVLAEVEPSRPEYEPLGRLWDGARTGAPPPAPLGPAPGAERVRAKVERLKGAGDVELMHQGGVGEPGAAARGFLALEDGPELVAYATVDRDGGDALFDAYVAMHTGYDYVEYRNRALWILLGAVVRHPDPAWIRGAATQLAVGALAGSRSDFREPLPIVIEALAHRLPARVQAALAAADTLLDGRHSGDVTGAHCRRLAACAEAAALLAHDLACADDLLKRALALPRGFAGYRVPAMLSLAESAALCARLGSGAAARVRDEALDAALAAAHNVREPMFCALSTARANAMRIAWWLPSGLDVVAVAARLVASPGSREFAALHRVGEAYHRRDPAGAALPPEVRGATTLRALARLYRRPLSEFERLNHDQGWDVDAPLADGALVRVPDPGFATWIAARLAAEALVHPATPRGAPCVALCRSLAPVAAANPTALHTVLARTVLADPGAVDLPQLDALWREHESHP